MRPKITLDRDFDFYKLLGQDISVIGELRAQGALSNETYLDILKSGEIIPDKVGDIAAELAKIEQGLLGKEEKTQKPKQSSIEQLKMQQEDLHFRPILETAESRKHLELV